MDAFEGSNLYALIALVIPGFISMRVYSLLNPADRMSLKDGLLEAGAFGVANFVFMWWAIVLLLRPGFVSASPWAAYGLIILVFLLAPIVWPVLAFLALRRLSARGLILDRAPTSWDHFFGKRQPCWVIVHLKDGRRIGGYYGADSYASSYPKSGHIYLEQLWKLEADGTFGGKVERSKGIVLRPDDYQFIEVFEE